MNFARSFYRTRQFLNALWAEPEAEDLQEISAVLSPPQLALFKRMQLSEQAHSLSIYKQLRSQEKNSASDLLVAALLHDVGKSRYPLHIWERVWIVLAQGLFPGWADRVGKAAGLEGKRAWWQRPLIVASQHAQWGADLAEEAGISPLAVNLIRRHQNFSTSKIVTLEDRLLRMLQAADGSS